MAVNKQHGLTSTDSSRTCFVDHCTILELWQRHLRDSTALINYVLIQLVY